MMNKKYYLLLFLLLLTPSLIIPRVYGFNDILDMQEGIPKFYLVALNKSESIGIHTTRQGYGNFCLFWFNQRPMESFINPDKSIDNKIFTQPTLVQYNLSINPSIVYTANETKIFYLQIVLANNGSDILTLTSTKDLTNYYLPQIPGYSFELTVIVSIVALLFSIIIYKRKFSNYKKNS
ncbi:MAG: hypothetical protein GF317_02300 [Candidatus Lokiarchaeota archaeon]|nr:hypothetical protein [Candidatus Lokiarchaeota archaeon]MBD3198739.1 hypothetical protein [Candidatus Lokiarchaeota archaeon]